MELEGAEGAGCLMATCGRSFGFEMKRGARQSRFRGSHAPKWRVSFQGKFRGRTCAVRFAGLPAGRRFFMGRDCMTILESGLRDTHKDCDVLGWNVRETYGVHARSSAEGVF
jgi:hypothetical protein